MAWGVMYKKVNMTPIMTNAKYCILPEESSWVVTRQVAWLELRHIKDSVDACYPRRETIQQIRICTSASTNAKGTQPPASKHALTVQHWEGTGAEHDSITDSKLQTSMVFVMILFLPK